MPSVYRGPKESLNLSEDGIERIIASLESVSEGELGVAMLVACGERAIPSLRRFLLEGPPKSVYVGRQRAVRALSELGAFPVLSEYLMAEKHVADPALRYAEEAVENTAASAIEKWKTEEAFGVLLKVIEKRPLRGAVEAIGSYGRKEAVPYLIRHLEDDVARPSAEKALTQLRSLAVGELVDAVRSPEPSGSSELPGSLRRRQSALAVLAAGKVPAAQWERLCFLLYEADEVLSTRAAGMALALSGVRERQFGIRILVSRLASGNWTVVAEAEQILLENYGQTCAAIETEMQVLADAGDAQSRKLLAILRSIARRGEAA